MEENEFRFKKKFGQNFISDGNLINSIIEKAGITKTDTVLEIGPGAGAMTLALAKAAARVVAVEIDRELEPLLEEKLAGITNVDIIWGDVLKLQKDDLQKRIGGQFKLVANLPYYITTPIIFKFIEEDFDVSHIVVMVQKEVADRIVAAPKTKDYGILSVMLQSVGDVRIIKTVDRKMFFPSPNVDSAIVRIDINKSKYAIMDKKCFREVVRNSFAWRRKTLANCLQMGFGFSKEETVGILSKLKLDVNIRGEALDVPTFVEMANLVSKMKKK